MKIKQVERQEVKLQDAVFSAIDNINWGNHNYQNEKSINLLASSNEIFMVSIVLPKNEEIANMMNKPKVFEMKIQLLQNFLSGKQGEPIRHDVYEYSKSKNAEYIEFIMYELEILNLADKRLLEVYELNVQPA